MEPLIAVWIWIIPIAITLAIGYFAIKAAVKNGVKAALVELADEKDAASWPTGAQE